MSDERQVTIALTEAQVGRVLREASGSAGLAPAFSSALSDPATLAKSVLPFLADQGYSRSVLRALLVLAAFPADGTERELSAVAELAIPIYRLKAVIGSHPQHWLLETLSQHDPLPRRAL